MLSTADMKGSPTFTLRQVAQSRTSVHSSRHLRCTVFRSGKEINGLAQQKSKMPLQENHNLHPNWGCSLTGDFNQYLHLHYQSHLLVPTKGPWHGWPHLGCSPFVQLVYCWYDKGERWCRISRLQMLRHFWVALSCLAMIFPAVSHAVLSFQLIVHDFDGASPAQKLNSSKKFATIVQYTTQSRM